MRLLLLVLLSVLSLANALFFGCGCRQCACATASYGYQQASYPSASYGYQQASYPSSYGSFSQYPPGPISGYILRPVGLAQNSGYAVAGGYSGAGTPVIHSKLGHIGYVQSPDGSLPNGPYYWQPAMGAPYERVSVGGFLF